MSYIPEIDADACSAHGDCVTIAPEVFELDHTALVVGTGPNDLVFAAAEACPSIAIRVIDDETGEQIFP